MGATRRRETNVKMFSRNPVRRHSAERGFTLIEMMIVVAIIGISAALAGPNYNAWIARYQLRQSVAEITNQLMLARMGAMNRNSTVTASVTAANGHVTVSGTDATGTLVLANDQALPHITGFNPANPSIIFTSLGLRSGGGAADQVVQVTNDRGVIYSFRITPGGKASWCASSTCP